MPDHAHSSLPASSDGSSIGGGLLPFPVAAVVVGEDLASLDALFRNLPADLGAAFVVLPPSSAQGRERVLQVLTEAAAMPVMSAEPDDALGPGVIQVAPWSADKLSILVNGTWRQRGTGGHASAADAFLSSLARDQGG